MALKTDLHNVNWNSRNHSPETNQNIKHFLKYSLSYMKNIQINVKGIQIPWISKGLEKLSKQKQK